MKSKHVAVLTLLLIVAGAVASCGSSRSSSDAPSVDAAFVAQMIPHHQMAVEMAKTAQRDGQRRQITALADDIVRTQSSEIAELRAAAKRLDVPGGTSMASDARTLGLSMDEMGMSMDTDALATAEPFDRAFIDDMLPHHEGAVRMARAELARGDDPELRALAKRIIAAQTREIEGMRGWRQAWFGTS